MQGLPVYNPPGEQRRFGRTVSNVKQSTVSSILRDYDVESPEERWLTAVGGDLSGGDDVFARSIPLTKAFEDCILAYEMNGRTLPRSMGTRSD